MICQLSKPKFSKLAVFLVTFSSLGWRNIMIFSLLLIMLIESHKQVLTEKPQCEHNSLAIRTQV